MTQTSNPDPAPAPPSIVDGREHSVDPRSVKVSRMIGVPVTLLIAMLPLIFITLGWALGGIPTVIYLPLLGGLLLILTLPVLFAYKWPAARHRHLRYLVDEGGLRIRRGVFWRKVIWIPISRVQHTDFTRGPLQRRFGLATLSWVPEFWAAALALQAGHISRVTETQYGYHILRLEERTIVPFSEARSAVARDIADRIEDPNAVLEGWMAELMADERARRLAALAEAEGRSLTVPPSERAELVRTWGDQVYQWTAALGFRYGVEPRHVAEAALEALAKSGQLAELARADLVRHRDLLEARYDIRVAGTPPSLQP